MGKRNAQSVPDRVQSIMKRVGLTQVNKAIETPKHPHKSHVVMAHDPVSKTYKLIRFGQQGVKGSPPKRNESRAWRARRDSFKARHAENISRGLLSAAYWADRVKW